MALDPHSEERDLTLPDDYKADHPTEHPEDWGWHGEWGKWAHVAGWVVVAILLVMMTATHYNLEGALALGVFAAGLAAMLVWDWRRRRNSWRN